MSYDNIEIVGTIVYYRRVAYGLCKTYDIMGNNKGTDYYAYNLTQQPCVVLHTHTTKFSTLESIKKAIDEDISKYGPVDLWRILHKEWHYKYNLMVDTDGLLLIDNKNRKLIKQCKKYNIEYRLIHKTNLNDILFD